MDAAAAAPAAAAPLLKVRTVTTGINLSTMDRSQWSKALERAAAFNAAAAEAFTKAGFEVQTTRIAANSFEEWCNVADASAAMEEFRFIDSELARLGVGLFNAGPAALPEAVRLVPSIVGLGPRISASGALLDPLDAPGASRLADAILSIASTTVGGEGNFQFCCSFNMPPGIPFFPAAYHASGTPTCFAVGCETSPLLAEALPKAGGDLKDARERLMRVFVEQLKPIESVSTELAALHSIAYHGIDASVAPLGTCPPLSDSFEAVGLGRFGESGTLAVASLVTSALKMLMDRERTGLTICGYTGLMLPPCEDAGLARRAAEGGYRVHDLLMYSAVCGLGLDTVPIPGDVERSKLAALLLDVAALAFRLDKPLSARLFPVPGKVAGDATSFANQFLCNTRVFAVP